MSINVRELDPIPAEEAGLCYTQQPGRDAEFGCIGHMRFEPGSELKFSSEWFPHVPELETDELWKEFQTILDELRQHGPLQDPQATAGFCERHPEAAIPGDMGMCGFRLDGENITYYVRCSTIPRGNSYIYLYDKDRLNGFLERNGPDIMEHTTVRTGVPTIPPRTKNWRTTVSRINLNKVRYYIVTEIQVPEGYILDSTPREVYLRPGKTTEITVVNDRKPSLIVKKVDSVTGEPIEGVKFQIWRGSDHTTTGDYYDLGVYYTDPDGLIHLEQLDTGWYKIKELETVPGYIIRQPDTQEIYLAAGQDRTVASSWTASSCCLR